jgi:two-component system response regulator HydG
VPPLRARPSDIPLLADHFLRVFAEREQKDVRSISPSASRALLEHPWPGNVRELQNAIEQAVVLAEGDHIDVADLPFEAKAIERDPLRLMVPGVTLAELERFAILRTLEAVGGSPSKAAKILGVSRRTIQYRLHEWGMAKDKDNAPPDEPDRGAG